MDWRFPEDVRGWLSPVEGAKLADLARGKRVLEIGSYEGKSTICMAQVAASVDCIDPCDGRATTAPGEHLEPLTANLLRYGVNGNVRIFVGTTDDVAIDLDPGAYDLVFIDGNHQRDMVENDIRHAKRLLAPGGRIAFHDYRSECDPGVTAAVDDLLFQGAVLEGVAGTVAVVCPRPAPEQKPLVYITMPRGRRYSAFGAVQGLDFASHGRCNVGQGYALSSGLDRNFNHCFVNALKARTEGVTHWAILHDDIAPKPGWLDTLVGEMVRTGAGAVSGVVPIKDMRGLTSTAVETDDLWFPRRLSLKEVFDLPETFGDKDVGGEILLNTGIWLCDLGQPWVQEILDGTTTELPAFQTLSRVIRKPDGSIASQNRSEDWEWSRELRRRGVKQVATRKVKLEHVGEHEFDNYSPWGQWETDEVYVKRMEKLAAAAAR